jgi:hypothetical protein
VLPPLIHYLNWTITNEGFVICAIYVQLKGLLVFIVPSLKVVGGNKNRQIGIVFVLPVGTLELKEIGRIFELRVITSLRCGKSNTFFQITLTVLIKPRYLWYFRHRY